jgi:hypothetical protein
MLRPWTDILNLELAQNTGRRLILALLQRRKDLAGHQQFKIELWIAEIT